MRRRVENLWEYLIVPFIILQMLFWPVVFALVVFLVSRAALA